MHHDDMEGDGTSQALKALEALEALADRVALLELLVFRLSDEVRTRRLVVEDPAGIPRVVGEVLDDGTAQVEVVGDGTSVCVFAVPTGSDLDRYGGARAMGIRLSADDEALSELDAWAEADGKVRAHLQVGGG